MKTVYLFLLAAVISLMSADVCVAQRSEFGPEDMEYYYDIKYDDGSEYGMYFKILSEEDCTVAFVDPLSYLFDSGIYWGDIKVPATVEYEGKTYTVVETDPLAFWYCRVVSIDFPTTLKKLNSILGCESLETLRLNDGLEQMDHGINYCTYLKSIELPEGLKQMKYSIEETAIERILIPEGCEILKSCNKNPSLKVVELPSSSLTIMDSFNECPAVSEIILHAEVPYDYPFDSFEDVDKSKCILYVPDNSVEDYKNTVGWNYYESIKPISALGVAEVSGSLETEEYYTIDGVRLDAPAEGLNIVRNGSKVTKRICK